MSQSRHAGHADIVRELFDGVVGLHEGNDNLPEGDATWWQTYRNRWKGWRGEQAAPVGPDRWVVRRVET